MRVCWRRMMKNSVGDQSILGDSWGVMVKILASRPHSSHLGAEASFEPWGRLLWESGHNEVQGRVQSQGVRIVAPSRAQLGPREGVSRAVENDLKQAQESNLQHLDRVGQEWFPSGGTAC